MGLDATKAILIPYKGISPKIHSSVFLAPGSIVIGDVEIGKESGIWFGAIVRGDVNYIKIGKRTNIQDLSVVHVTKDRFPTIIEDDVTVGHSVVVHGCVIHSRCLLGIGSRILDGAEVGPDSIVAAGSVVTEGFRVPPRTLVMGIPAKIRRELTEEEVERIKNNSLHYVDYRLHYMNSK